MCVLVCVFERVKVCVGERVRERKCVCWGVRVRDCVCVGRWWGKEGWGGSEVRGCKKPEPVAAVNVCIRVVRRTDAVDEGLAGGTVDQDGEQHDAGRQEEDAVAGICFFGKVETWRDKR